jgi:hypothetical protein
VGLNRKQYRVKRHSCALCKPNKMGWGHRFKAKERNQAKVHLAQKQAVTGRG